MSGSANGQPLPSKNRKLQIALLVVAILTALILFYWAARPSNAPTWTGFSLSSQFEEGRAAEKTLWDWLELMLLPLALAIGAWWIGRSRLNLTPDIDATKAAGIDDASTIVRTHEERRVQGYIDRISELLLSQGLRESAPNDEVRHIARAQTVTVLWGLSGRRKGAIIRFLYEARLIQHPEPIITLTGADLSTADLSGINLSEADLRQVHLSEAKLTEAHLSKTDLTGADLVGADLQGAMSGKGLPGAGKWVPPNLSQANLNEAILRGACLIRTNLTEVSMQRTHLENADLREAILTKAILRDAWLLETNFTSAGMKEADLTGAKLEKACLNNAILIKAKLSGSNLQAVEAIQANLKGANLQDAVLQDANFAKAYLFHTNLNGANLRGASLRGANLSGADLTNAILENADLRGAYLSGAKVTGKQLDQALSLDGAIIPDNERNQLQIGVAGQKRGPDYQLQTSDNDSDQLAT